MHEEFKFIENICLSNGYPKRFIETQIQKTLGRYIDRRNNIEIIKSKHEDKNVINNSTKKQQVFIDIPFYGKPSKVFSTRLTKLAKSVNPHINIRSIQRPPPTIAKYFPFKDIIPKELQSNIVYKINCSECNASYIGKTERQVIRRLDEHKTKIDVNSITETNFIPPIVELNNSAHLNQTEQENKGYIPKSFIDHRHRDDKELNLTKEQHIIRENFSNTITTDSNPVTPYDYCTNSKQSNINELNILQNYSKSYLKEQSRDGCNLINSNFNQREINMEHTEETVTDSNLKTRTMDTNNLRRPNRIKKKNSKYRSNLYIEEDIGINKKHMEQTQEQQIVSTYINENTVNNSDVITPTTDATNLRRSDRIKSNNSKYCLNTHNNEVLNGITLPSKSSTKQYELIRKCNDKTKKISGIITLSFDSNNNSNVVKSRTETPVNNSCNTSKDDDHPFDKKHLKSAIKQHEITTKHKIDWINWDILSKDQLDYRLKVRESLFIIKHKPILNKTVCSVPLIIFPEGLQTNKPKIR
jgi:hypothetical protein